MASKTESRISNGERMAIIETKVNNIETILNNVDQKLDDTIKNKADKEEVERIRDKLNKAIWWFFPTIILLLVSLVAFLLKERFF